MTVATACSMAAFLVPVTPYTAFAAAVPVISTPSVATLGGHTPDDSKPIEYALAINADRLLTLNILNIPLTW